MAFRADVSAVRQAGYTKAIENTQRELDVLLRQPGQTV